MEELRKEVFGYFQEWPALKIRNWWREAEESFTTNKFKGGEVFGLRQSKKGMLAWMKFLKHAFNIIDKCDHNKWSRVIADAVVAIAGGCLICRRAEKWIAALDKCVDPNIKTIGIGSLFAGVSVVFAAPMINKVGEKAYQAAKEWLER